MNKRDFGHSPADYQIKVRGRLGDQWSEWFGDMEISTEGSVTTFTARTRDQPALHGLLVRVHNLGLPLISVKRVESEQKTCK